MKPIGTSRQQKAMVMEPRNSNGHLKFQNWPDAISGSVASCEMHIRNNDSPFLNGLLPQNGDKPPKS